MTTAAKVFSLRKTLFNGFATLEAWGAEGDTHDTLVLRTSDSVAGLLVDLKKRRVLLVQQVRAPMIRPENPTGTIIEAVAGRFDIDLGPPKELLIKEAREEAGVFLQEKDVLLLNGRKPLALSAGILTEQTYLAVAFFSPDTVEAGDHVERGAEHEDERITRVWVPVEKFITMVHEDLRVAFFAQYLRAEGFGTRPTWFAWFERIRAKLPS